MMLYVNYISLKLGKKKRWDSIPKPTLGRTRETGVWVWTWALLSRPQEGSFHPLTSAAGQKLLSSPPA